MNVLDWLYKRYPSFIVALTYLVGLVALLVVTAVPMLTYKATQIYKYDDINHTEATRGMIFQNTIKISNYQSLGSGNSLMGSYDMYTRSDRHSDTIKVYE